MAATLHPYKMAEEPVAFGIVAIMATFIVEDGEGASSSLEEKASAIPNASGVDTVSVDRI